MDAHTEDLKFLDYVIKSLVDYPDQVTIHRTHDDYGIFLQVHVAKEDMGKVIGKKGRTADALKTLLKVLGAKSNISISMKIVDPEKDGLAEAKDSE